MSYSSGQNGIANRGLKHLAQRTGNPPGPDFEHDSTHPLFTFSMQQARVFSILKPVKDPKPV
jgi:hypothetical protein